MARQGRTRRDFFRRVGERPPADLNLLRLGRPAMGTVFEILFPAQYRKLTENVHRALDRIRGLERLMTIFEPGSQISRINREGADHPVEVEEELFQLLELSVRLYEETDRAFDIAAGALWRCWGFAQKKARIPLPEEIHSARERAGAHLLELDALRRSVALKKEGVEINLGSIGKGFALDRAAELLQNAGLEEAFLHAGHSSFFALGKPDPSSRGWRLGVRHPLIRDANFVTLRLSDMGMATSGAGEQFFEIDGKRYGHIIDPRLGRPVEGILSATALAPTAALADALSTAFFTMPLSAVEQYCDTHPGVGAVVVPAGRDNEELFMHCFGVAGQCIDASEQ